MKIYFEIDIVKNLGGTSLFLNQITTKLTTKIYEKVDSIKPLSGKV